jgi:Flp pilus assembly protein TadB
VRRALRRFGLFWVDFVVGDDWTLVVVVVVALAATWALSRSGFPGWVLLVILVMGALVTSVVRAKRLTARLDRTDDDRPGRPAESA